ncbi:MAG: hypothetical protein R3F11_01840 [Verrucomicrobiales bacterium]
MMPNPPRLHAVWATMLVAPLLAQPAFCQDDSIALYAAAEDPPPAITLLGNAIN